MRSALLMDCNHRLSMHWLSMVRRMDEVLVLIRRYFRLTPGRSEGGSWLADQVGAASGVVVQTARVRRTWAGAVALRAMPTLDAKSAPNMGHPPLGGPVNPRLTYSCYVRHACIFES